MFFCSREIDFPAFCFIEQMVSISVHMLSFNSKHVKFLHAKSINVK